MSHDAIFGPEPKVGDNVYADLGDSVWTGGERYGVLTGMDDEFIYINDQPIHWDRLTYLEVR